jgi:hypothetical protein
MDGTQIIVALAASSSQRTRDRYWAGVLDGVELALDKFADEEVPSSEWVPAVRDLIAVAREHQP